MVRLMKCKERFALMLPLLLLSCSTTPFMDYREGKRLSDSGQYQEAIVVYSRSINLLPTDAEAYLGRGYAYEHLGEYDKALADFNRVIELRPEDAEAYFVRGLLHDVMGRAEEAIRDYSMAIDLKPFDADFSYYRGMAWERLGNREAATADYRDAAVYGHADAAERLKALGGTIEAGETK